MFGTSSVGETKKRTLAPSDITGIKILYGDLPNPSTGGSSSGGSGGTRENDFATPGKKNSGGRLGCGLMLSLFSILLVIQNA